MKIFKELKLVYTYFNAEKFISKNRVLINIFEVFFALSILRNTKLYQKLIKYSIDIYTFVKA